MSSQNSSIIRRLFDEVFTKGNLTLLDELVATNVKLNDPAHPNHRDGIQSYKQIEQTYKQAFPMKKFKIEDLMTADDKVIVRWTCRGTHKGDLEGIEPTNRDVQVSGISIYRLTNGKVSEIWQNWDRLGLFEQIGEVEPATALH
jgi:steroid delta-isomerase-like uncharacterized protein